MAKALNFDGYSISNLRYPVVTVAGNYSASLEDYIILSAGGSLTLPNAATNRGKVYIVKSGDLPTMVGVLLPLPDPTLLTVDAGSCAHLVSDGVTWVDITPRVGETP